MVILALKIFIATIILFCAFSVFTAAGAVSAISTAATASSVTTSSLDLASESVVLEAEDYLKLLDYVAVASESEQAVAIIDSRKSEFMEQLSVLKQAARNGDSGKFSSTKAEMVRLTNAIRQELRPLLNGSRHGEIAAKVNKLKSELALERKALVLRKQFAAHVNYLDSLEKRLSGLSVAANEDEEAAEGSEKFHSLLQDILNLRLKLIDKESLSKLTPTGIAEIRSELQSLHKSVVSFKASIRHGALEKAESLRKQAVQKATENARKRAAAQNTAAVGSETAAVSESPPAAPGSAVLD